MLKDQTNLESGVQIADRRTHARVPIRSVAYVELDDDNGGLILNVSEGGIGVQSAEMIVGERFSRIRFQLPSSEKWIESAGKVAWLGKTRKEAGIQFLNLTDDARRQIQTWIYSAAFGQGIPRDQGRFKSAWESEETKSEAHEPTGSGTSEISSMFPSEKVVPPRRRSGVDIHLNDDPNDGSALELGIAPGPVKRRVSPSEQRTRRTASASSQPDPTAASSAPIETSKVGASSRQAYNYPEIPGLSRDPFASVAADRAEIPPAEMPPSVLPPKFGTHAYPDASAYALREHYRGLGYQPQPFEEPSGKGWYIAAGILVVLLGIGAVLAMGPANVKSLVMQHLPSSIRSSDLTPPPPYDSLQKSPAPEASLAPSETNDKVPVGSAADGAILNPGVNDPPTRKAPADSAPRQSADTSAASDAPTGHSAARETDIPSDERDFPENAAEITRRFQMEHSTSSFAPPPTTAYQPQQHQNASSSILQTPAPASRNERTADAYPESAATSSPTATATSPVSQTAVPNSSPQTPVAPSGSVAVSSHFYALRGEDPQTSLAKQGLAVGQLISIHQPAYSLEAERAHVEGTVQLRLTIDQMGRVEIVHAVSGPAMLVPAAVDAVRQWRYAATTVEGKAQESVDDVTIVFRLANSASSPR